MIGNETNPVLVAKTYMNWISNETYPPYATKPYLNEIGWMIVNESNSPRLFIRTTLASWFIFQKIGNCGEDAYYFAEMMNYSGYQSKVLLVEGGDHAFAEFYTHNGTKFIVDPSTDQFVNNALAFGNGHIYWPRVVAHDLSGNETDVTSEFLSNTSLLTIIPVNNSVLTKFVTVDVESTFLKNHSPEIYSEPLSVIKHSFSNDTRFQVSLGSNREYQISTTVNLFLLTFKLIQPLNLTQNRTVYLDISKLVSFNDVYYPSAIIGLSLVILLVLLTLRLIPVLTYKNKNRTRI